MVLFLENLLSLDIDVIFLRSNKRWNLCGEFSCFCFSFIIHLRVPFMSNKGKRLEFLKYEPSSKVQTTSPIGEMCHRLSEKYFDGKCEKL